MKRVIYIALLAILSISLLAQTPDTTYKLGSIGFGSVRYSSTVTGEGSFFGSVGFIVHVAGPLYQATYTDVGGYGSINPELLLLTKVQNSNLYVGLIGGPNADFTGSSPVTSYLSGAAGGIAAYQFKGDFLGFRDVGLMASAKYKFSVDDQAQSYVDGWTVGLGVFLPVKP